MTKTILTVLLVVAVVAVVLMGDVATTLLNPRYISYLLDMWGQNPPPELLGGHSFREGFKSASKATLYMISYPIRLAYWCMRQVNLLIIWSTGNVKPIGGAVV